MVGYIWKSGESWYHSFTCFVIISNEHSEDVLLERIIVTIDTYKKFLGKTVER